MRRARRMRLINFNPRLPEGRRPCRRGSRPRRSRISIHASPKGGDATCVGIEICEATFQSTPPRREATGRRTVPSHPVHISIHASPKGGDDTMRRTVSRSSTFQSTPPRREATVAHAQLHDCGVISIHASPKGGDMSVEMFFVVGAISIHASPKGGDKPPAITSPTSLRFQSTPPRREATLGELREPDRREISIHASPKGGDAHVGAARAVPVISIHASPKGGDVNEPPSMSTSRFQSTPPRREATAKMNMSSHIMDTHTSSDQILPQKIYFAAVYTSESQHQVHIAESTVELSSNIPINLGRIVKVKAAPSVRTHDEIMTALASH